MSEEKEVRRKRRGSLFFPLLLIIIGVVALLQTIGAMRGDIWDTIFNLWPVLLIMIGLDSFYQREGIVAGTLFATSGVIFLLANFGYLNVSIWQIIINLWPLLLIAFGIDIVFSRSSFLVSLLGAIAFLAIFLGAIWIFGRGVTGGQALSGEKISQPLADVSQAKILIDSPVGDLRIHALDNSTDIVNGVVSAGTGMQVVENYSREGDKATYSITASGSTAYLPGSTRANWIWDLGLTALIPVELETSLSVGDAELELAELDIENLSADIGVGSLTISLPEEGRFEGAVDGAIGEITIYVPDGMAVRIQGETGIASLQVPPDYQKQGNVYTSPGYMTAENQADLAIDMAIGLVIVREGNAK